MTRPVRALLDARALRANFEQARTQAPGSRIMAVVKANAYGHGLAWAARVLRDADAFGVACMEEGLALRDAGMQQPICLLGGFFDADELPLITAHRLSPVVHHESQLEALERTAGPGTLSVWVKIDTGMHRLGFSPRRLPDILARLAACRRVTDVKVLSHFGNADDIDDPATGHQIARFLEAAPDGERERSLANSAGLLAWPASRLEWVRPGIMLYGVSPLLGRSAAAIDLRSVMTLTSAVTAVRTLRKGDAVGYGGDWICPVDMPVGVVACGYGDGYPRHAAPGTPVLVNGRRAPLIGRVSMDMLTVDLRGQPEARPGDPVVLWGAGLPVEEVAARAGTIGYELLCGVTARVPRVEIRH